MFANLPRANINFRSTNGGGTPNPVACDHTCPHTDSSCAACLPIAIVNPSESKRADDHCQRRRETCGDVLPAYRESSARRFAFTY